MRTPDEITNTENVIDSRDVIARIEYLETIVEDAREEWAELETQEQEKFENGYDYFLETCQDEAEELEKLKALAEQGEQYAADWEYGATLISDEYFTEYAEELCKDIGAISSTAYYIVIDWEATAENIKQDYSAIDFDGSTYWVR